MPFRNLGIRSIQTLNFRALEVLELLEVRSPEENVVPFRCIDSRGFINLYQFELRIAIKVAIKLIKFNLAELSSLNFNHWNLIIGP